MNTRERPGIFGGLSVAAMLTAALIGIFFFAWRVAGLPFVPFDTFDWLTRVLPGTPHRVRHRDDGEHHSSAQPGSDCSDRENGGTGDSHRHSVHRRGCRRRDCLLGSSRQTQQIWT